MSDAKVLGHVIHEHRPAGSDAKFERGPGRTSFLPDFPCFAENQQKAARSSAGWNECPGEPTTLLERPRDDKEHGHEVVEVHLRVDVRVRVGFLPGDAQSRSMHNEKIRVHVRVSLGTTEVL